MSEINHPPEEHLAERLHDLPPAPAGWVAAAQALPAARAALADVEQRVLDGAEARAAVTADLESALRRAGHLPDPALVQALRRLER